MSPSNLHAKPQGQEAARMGMGLQVGAGALGSKKADDVRGALCWGLPTRGIRRTHGTHQHRRPGPGAVECGSWHQDCGRPSGTQRCQGARR